MRGRSERIAFAASFEEIYHFRNVYSGTTFMFPILGRLGLGLGLGLGLVTLTLTRSGLDPWRMACLGA